MFLSDFWFKNLTIFNNRNTVLKWVILNNQLIGTLIRFLLYKDRYLKAVDKIKATYWGLLKASFPVNISQITIVRLSSSKVSLCWIIFFQWFKILQKWFGIFFSMFSLVVSKERFQRSGSSACAFALEVARARSVAALRAGLDPKQGWAFRRQHKHVF